MYMRAHINITVWLLLSLYYMHMSMLFFSVPSMAIYLVREGEREEKIIL